MRQKTAMENYNLRNWRELPEPLQPYIQSLSKNKHISHKDKFITTT